MAQHEFSTILKESKSRIDSINDPNDLLGLPYPQGCIQWYNNGMIIAAGGAGPTKCGLANGFEILQFIKKQNKFNLKRHSWYNTGGDIVYCIRQHPIYPYQFIAGIGNNLVIMEISSYSQPQQNNAFQYDWMTISKTKYPSNANANAFTPRKSPINTIYVLPNIEYKQLPNEEDPFCVSKVEISLCGKLIATGGTDGIVRLFKYDFIDPTNTSKYKEIDITHQHFKFLNKKKKLNQAPPEIERLLFYKNKYLSICNREFACYIWNINKNKMETILMDKSHKTHYINYIFRDCVFIEDNQANKYCICAVNGVRKSRKSRATPSYLYQYFISNNESKENSWYKRHYIKIIRSDVKRMIGNMKTRNIITLHLNGMICVLDGLNLTKLYSFKNEGRFFMDIAISPNLYSNYKMKNYQEYLLLSLMNDLLIKPITLKPCSIQKGNNVGSCWCSFKCITVFLSVIIVIIGIMIGCLQQDSYQYASTFQNSN